MSKDRGSGEATERSGGYGYVVWADSDNGRTSECKMSSGSMKPWLTRNSSQSLDKRPKTAVLAAALQLAHVPVTPSHRMSSCVNATP
jgi:hypothetical protein